MYYNTYYNYLYIRLLKSYYSFFYLVHSLQNPPQISKKVNTEYDNFDEQHFTVTGNNLDSPLNIR